MAGSTGWGIQHHVTGRMYGTSAPREHDVHGFGGGDSWWVDHHRQAMFSLPRQRVMYADFSR